MDNNVITFISFSIIHILRNLLMTVHNLLNIIINNNKYRKIFNLHILFLCDKNIKYRENPLSSAIL